MTRSERVGSIVKTAHPRTRFLSSERLFHAYPVVTATHSHYIIQVCILTFSKHRNSREDVEISGKANKSTTRFPTGEVDRLSLQTPLAGAIASCLSVLVHILFFSFAIITRRPSLLLYNITMCGDQLQGQHATLTNVPPQNTNKSI